tara:strand:- start:300 stop:1025 length:726 start_codon:yes stop_codon:yes gene_type:complete
MPVKFNINKAYNLYIESGGKTNFSTSLKKVLRFMQNDANVNNSKEAAYFLATAKSESDYSLQRWESDYLCGEKGVPYVGQPCQKALDYYRSNQGGKSNYYTKGVDSTGTPYFGRGLIQLTNKYNYKTYGDLIGVDLVDKADKAMIPVNSYKIATAYLNRKTFKHVNNGDLTQARKSVNGGTKGVDRTNASYYRWLNIFQNPSVNFKYFFWTKKRRIYFGIMTALGLAVGGYFMYRAIKLSK